MKILEIRIEFLDNPTDNDLNILGEGFQLTLPSDLEANDFRIGNVTYEIIERKPKPDLIVENLKTGEILFVDFNTNSKMN